MTSAQNLFNNKATDAGSLCYSADYTQSKLSFALEDVDQSVSRMKERSGQRQPMLSVSLAQSLR